MDLQLNNKNAIITGGSAGIGLACAQALVKEGANVLIVGRDQTRLDAAVEKLNEIGAGNAAAMRGDLSEDQTAKRVADFARSKFDTIDILINNAGSAPAGSFFDLKDESFIESWNLKLLGYIRMTREIAPFMIKQKDGKIINIIGSAGRTPTNTFLPGSTANAALLNFTKGISKELAESNVRINAISPGITATERAKTLAEQRAKAKGISVEEENKDVLASIPLGRLVDPDEIAAMALLLASNLVPSITGNEIVIDGGAKPGV